MREMARVTSGEFFLLQYCKWPLGNFGNKERHPSCTLLIITYMKLLEFALWVRKMLDIEMEDKGMGQNKHLVLPVCFLNFVF